MITVHHLGRTGAIAGGMTQVLNDYLEWTFPTMKQHVIVSRASTLLESARRFVSAWRQISTLDPARDIVVGHVSQGGSFIREGGLMVHARRRGLPVVAHIHGSSFPGFARSHRRLTRWALRRAHVIVVLSREANEALDAVGIAAEVRYIPNAVAGAPPAAKEKIAVFGGAVTRRKGVDTLLQAWSMSQPPGWTLVLAGPLIEPDLVVDLPPQCRVAGAMPRAELLELLGRTSIAVLPSTDEAMPLFILEGMSAGAAVVATPVGAIESVLADGGGIVVPVGDADALAQALQALTRSATQLTTIGGAGRERWLRHYSPEAVIPQLEQAWTLAAALAVQQGGETDAGQASPD